MSQVLHSATATAVAGTAGTAGSAGAVAGAVVTDCRYGSSKNSVPVIKISKKNKRRKKKNIPRDSRRSVSRVHSHPCIPQLPP